MRALAGISIFKRGVAVGQDKAGQAGNRRRKKAVVRDFVAVAGNDHIDPPRAVAVPGIVGRQIDIDRRRRLPTQLGAHRLDILILLVAAARVDCIAVVAARTDDQTDAHRVGHRPAHRSSDVELVVIAIGRLDTTLELIARLFGHIVDQAADDAFAKAQCLRPLQHLDALQIIEIEQRSGTARQIGTIDENPDRAIGARALDVRPDAADEQFGIDRAFGAQLQTGNAVRDFGKILDPRLLQRGAAERLHRNRHVL